MATLVISHPNHGRMEHPLTTDEITIGRMIDNTIQIRDDSVSGRHARITRRNGLFHLEDLSSTNRCYLDGKEVLEVDLTNSCKLRFGNVECEFRPIDDQSGEMARLTAQRDAAEMEGTLSTEAFEAISAELGATEADGAGLRVESMELKSRAEDLARQIESIIFQRNALQRANDQLEARLAEVRQRVDSLSRQYQNISLELEQSRAELQRLVSAAEAVLSWFARTTKSRPVASTAPPPFSTPVPPGSPSPANPGSQESIPRNGAFPPLATSSGKSKCETVRVHSPEPLEEVRSIRRVGPSIMTVAPWRPPLRRVPSDHASAAAGSGARTEAADAPAIDPLPAISPAVLAGRGFTPGARERIVPLVADLRRLFALFSDNREDITPFREILCATYNLTQRTAGIDSNALFNLASALEALIRDVHDTPVLITDSVLHTIAQSLDLLELMLDDAYFRQATQLPAGRTLVIENDVETRNAVIAALKTVNLKPKWSPDPSQTLSFVRSRPLDLILIVCSWHSEDVEDPILHIRGMPLHGKTPVIALQNPGAPAPAGTEILSKPLNPRELAMKSITLMFKGQMGFT